jgi:hypothetical protein
MSNPIERNAPFFVNENKIGEAKSGEFDFDGAMTMEIGDDQVAFARGRTTIKASITSFIPVAGMKYRLDDVCEKQQDCTGSFFVNGRMRKFDGVLSGYTNSWDSAKGTCEGKWSFIGIMRKF